MTVQQFTFGFWLNYLKDAFDTFVPVVVKINPMKGAQCLPSADAAVRNLAIGQKHRDEPWFINCPLAQLFHGLGYFFVHVTPRPLTVLCRETRDEEIALCNCCLSNNFSFFRQINFLLTRWRSIFSIG